MPFHDLVVGQPDGDGVDAEVPPRQVLLDRCAQLDIGERSRPGVESRGAPQSRSNANPSASTVAVPNRSWTVSAPPKRSAARRATTTSVTFDDEVEFARGAAQQRVAHGPADHVHAGLPSQGGKHGLGPGGPQQLVHGANVPLLNPCG